MKATVVTLACLLIAPMAFAQTHSKRENHTTSATEQPITVTGTTIITSEGGSAAIYQPFKTLVVNKGYSGQVCSQRARSRCEREGRSDPNRDQTRHPRACLLRKHGRVTDG